MTPAAAVAAGRPVADVLATTIEAPMSSYPLPGLAQVRVRELLGEAEQRRLARPRRPRPVRGVAHRVLVRAGRLRATSLLLLRWSRCAGLRAMAHSGLLARPGCPESPAGADG